MDGFIDLQAKLDERLYTSVQTFKTDVINVLKEGIGFPAPTGGVEAKSSESIQAPSKDDYVVELDLNNVAHNTLTAEQKDMKKLVKRILRGLQPHFEDALRKESDIACRSYEPLPDLETLLNQSLQRRASGPSVGEGIRQTTETDQPITEQDDDVLPDGEAEAAAGKPEEMHLAPTPDDNAADPHRTAHDEAADDEAAIAAQLGQDTLHASNEESRIDRMDLDQGNGQPLTPPRSEKNSLDPFGNGGIPWYLGAFDIDGTTIYEERYSGREVLRDMSEELSELDDDVLDGLADSDPVVAPDANVAEVKKAVARKKQKRARNW
jgi:NuA3 HAT complex component NTO1